jgi:hypothetical protein
MGDFIVNIFPLGDHFPSLRRVCLVSLAIVPLRSPFLPAARHRVHLDASQYQQFRYSLYGPMIQGIVLGGR